ncbi:tripartite tricarboxylate transporter TctB family protein [Alkalicoccus saliphilus]|uniref:DUF1468 domain-containing protein n=1 Tax=Alkalicoccus saliphilus TaxID=200989 RepID=A0A2T4U5S0_9BACI|nr:tripartite tricarboxylate transporter TctB family protein [Alkalicoccus saliphilus]PTL38741.1 hypothetical protein C6Y45_09610 [Alkalicoccus saliphilus]
MFSIKSSVILGIVTIIFAGLAWTQTVGLPEQSSLFPRVILGSMGVVGVLMLIDGIRGGKQSSSEDTGLSRSVFVFQIVIPGLIMLFGYFLLTMVGFFVTSFIIIIILYLYQIYRMNEKRPTARDLIRGAILAASVTLAAYLMFSVVLGLPTPSGRFL